MAAFYFITLCFGGFLFVKGLCDSKDIWIIKGLVYGGISLAIWIPYVIAPYLRPQPWVWVYGMVMICLGTTSCCLIPACVPLLIFWIKQETKDYFGMK